MMLNYRTLRLHLVLGQTRGLTFMDLRNGLKRLPYQRLACVDYSNECAVQFMYKHSAQFGIDNYKLEYSPR